MASPQSVRRTLRPPVNGHSASVLTRPLRLSGWPPALFNRFSGLGVDVRCTLFRNRAYVSSGGAIRVPQITRQRIDRKADCAVGAGSRFQRRRRGAPRSRCDSSSAAPLPRHPTRWLPTVRLLGSVAFDHTAPERADRFLRRRSPGDCRHPSRRLPAPPRFGAARTAT